MSDNSHNKDMSGKVAVVTGGASGMGRLMALRLARRGAKVAVVDLNEEALTKVASEHENLSIFRCDVADTVAVASVIENVQEELGLIDYLAHAAALMPGRSLLDMSAEKIIQLMAINYGGTVNLTKAVLPGMRERNAGQIVIFGSIAGMIPSTGLGAYCATKAAVNSYAETLIQENADSDVHILLVCPPAVNTPLIQQAVAHGPKALAESSKTGKNMAQPEAIVDAIDNALAKGRDIIFPGQAAIAYYLRRISPGLMWKISRMANR